MGEGGTTNFILPLAAIFVNTDLLKNNNYIEICTDVYPTYYLYSAEVHLYFFVRCVLV